MKRGIEKHKAVDEKYHSTAYLFEMIFYISISYLTESHYSGGDISSKKPAEEKTISFYKKNKY